MNPIDVQRDPVRTRPMCGVAIVVKLTGLMFEKKERVWRMLRKRVS